MLMTELPKDYIKRKSRPFIEKMKKVNGWLPKKMGNIYFFTHWSSYEEEIEKGTSYHKDAYILSEEKVREMLDNLHGIPTSKQLKDAVKHVNNNESFILFQERDLGDVLDAYCY